ncbi:hypothetical protein O181_004159 [Austropuccinia psidii MF-1]|uniref:Uncharacterized protein n=1 Tax=Austropuccinia psidii MF-1 TaxID=1389203 RepID=A0A9Q3BFC5_9BASI|nr:hypothetical protein [Austropuccinia psidii MF-1]
MAAKQKEWELLPNIWIGTMSSYLKVKRFTGPEKTEDFLRGWKHMSCKGQVQHIKSGLKNQKMLPEDQKKKLAQGEVNSTVEAPEALKSAKKGQARPKEQSEGKEKRQRERKS